MNYLKIDPDDGGNEGILTKQKGVVISDVLAETEGFEPSVPNYQYDGLANRWFQPLTHVSNAFGIGGL